MPANWKLKGYLLAACNCDWGCPCSFDARPTNGFCEGGYTWHITEGSFNGLSLDGLSFSWFGHSPGPLHEGNVTAGALIDARASSQQRDAILKLLSGQEGGPWEIFAAITSKRLDPVFARYEVNVNGLESTVKAGDALELKLAKIKNPVTGAVEELQLRKPTGFTSKWADLGTTHQFRLSVPGLSYEHNGKYGEYSEFEYPHRAARSGLNPK